MATEHQPKVSFVIPAYNAAPYLERCLQSILEQTYQPFEIICVDDGSTDDTGQLLDNYASHDVRFRVIHQPNCGLVHSRKVGVSKVAGDYVSYVDADDEISLTRCEELLPAMETGTDMILADVVQVYGDGYQQRLENYLPEGFYNRADIEREVLPHLMDEVHVFRQLVRNSLCGCLFKRELIQKSQMEVDDSISVGEGCAAIVSSLLAAQSLSVVHKGNYYYYKNNSSMCHQIHEGWELLLQRKSNMALLRHLQGFSDCIPAAVRKSVKRQMTLLSYNNLLLHDYELFGGIAGQTIFPYGVPASSRIVLYGAGTLGVQLYRYLTANGGHVVLWCDRSHKKNRAAGLPVESPERIKDAEYDYILMGIGQYELAAGARQELISACGLTLADKIRLINPRELTSECLGQALGKLETMAVSSDRAASAPPGVNQGRNGD